MTRQGGGTVLHCTLSILVVLLLIFYHYFLTNWLFCSYVYVSVCLSDCLPV